MKKYYFLFFLLFFLGIGKSKAQYTVLLNFNGANGAEPLGSLTLSGNKFYGMTEYGGLYNAGEIFSMDTNGGNNTNLHNFYNDSLYGIFPHGNLTLSGNKFYGMTFSGGLRGYGNIFSIDTDGFNYKNLWDFDRGGDSNGTNPWGSLTLLGGKLYGITIGGGINYSGNIFSIDTNGSNYKDMWNFDRGGDTNGSAPLGNLIFYGEKFFGMTQNGGSFTDGNIFSIDTNGTGYKDLLDFYGLNGSSPQGSLILVEDKLYGMTYSGGLLGYGNIFTIDTNGNNYIDRLDFNRTNGWNPFGSLTYSAGILYGMTTNGGFYGYGVIFSMDTNGSNYHDRFDFDITNGSNPYGDLTLSGSKLFGMTHQGGMSGEGIIFTVDTNGNNFSVMYSFGAISQGAFPYSSFIISGGELFGMTSAGGLYNNGTIFSIDTNGNNYNKRFDFGKSSTNGANPLGSLILTNGKLYGMTQYGGINEKGNIFSIDTNGANYRDLWDFNDTGTNGLFPYYDLILSGTKLYGMTTNGGLYSYGNIFSIDTNGNRFKNLWNFDNIGTNGTNPYGDLTLLGGKLYGVTWEGGIYTDGSIFSIDTNGSGYEDLLDFNITNGEEPAGALTLSGNKLFGMAHQGGVFSYGNIFSIDSNGSNFKDLLDFNSFDGSIPSFSLTLSHNKLYGMTSYGGSGNGNIFSIDTNGSEFKEMYNFNGTNGAIPGGSLTPSGGFLYGMTSKGGTNNCGVVFKIDTSAFIASISNLIVPQNAINVFPNPNNGIFTIQLSVLSCQSSVEIYNVLGEKIFVETLPPQTSRSQSGTGSKGALNSINLTGQPDGVYLYRVRQDDGSLVGEGKIVVEK